MKKILLTISLLVSLVLLSSCANKDAVKSREDNASVPPETKADVLSIKDYFIQKENSKYVYEGQGNEYASYTVFMDYKEGNRVQLRSNNGGTEMVKVL